MMLCPSEAHSSGTRDPQRRLGLLCKIATAFHSVDGPHLRNLCAQTKAKSSPPSALGNKLNLGVFLFIFMAPYTLS